MCLVKVKGEVEDDVIVPARVVERDEIRNTETQIIETAPAIIERPSRSRRHSSSSSSSSSSSAVSRRSHSRSRSHRGGGGSSYHGGSSHGGDRGGDRRGSYYRTEERIIRDDRGRGPSFDEPRRSFRYVDPSPRGGAGGPRDPRESSEIRAEISRAEEHLQRAAEIQKREKYRKSIGYHEDPRASSASYRSRDGRRSEVVVVQEERTSRYR